MSALRNYPVIQGNRHTGLLQSISVDAAQKRVCALIVSCGFYGKKIVLAQHVRSIANGFILIDSIEKYKKCLDVQMCSFVRDTSGLLVGRITDYAIDEQTLHIQAIEMSPGYSPAERCIRIWVYEYAPTDENRSEFIVPAALGSEMNLCWEGSTVCECPL